MHMVKDKRRFHSSTLEGGMAQAAPCPTLQRLAIKICMRSGKRKQGSDLLLMVDFLDRISSKSS